MAVLAPPPLTDCGVVLAEFEEVTEDGDCAGYLGQAFDVRDIGGEGNLCMSTRRYPEKVAPNTLR